MLINNNNNNNSNNTHNNNNHRTKKGNTFLKMTYKLSARVVPKLLKAGKVDCGHDRNADDFYRPSVWMSESCSPAWAAVVHVVAPIRKLWPL